MRILFYRYGSICEPDIIETFKEYGFEVTEITERIYDKTFSPKKAVPLISKMLMEKEYHAVFSINFFPFISEVCELLKIRYLCWVVDWPVLELYSPSIKNSYNRIFIFDYKAYEDLVNENPTGIFYLPLAVNIKQKQDAIKMAGSKIQTKFSSDISFLGSLYTEKCPYQNLVDPPDKLAGYLEGLIEAQFLVYGYYFIDEALKKEYIDSFIKNVKMRPELPVETESSYRFMVSQYYIASQITVLERERLLRELSERFEVDLYTGSDASGLPKVCMKGLANSMTEMPVVFHNSKINLNITAKAIRSGISLRIWDIMGCGGFCLSNYQNEIPEYFVIGEEIETYSSKEELMEKCNYYLKNENRRREIAQNGFEKVQKHHTWVIRLSQLIEMAFREKK